MNPLFMAGKAIWQGGQQLVRLIWLTIQAFMANKNSSHGAALAFFTLFALPPLLVLLVLIVSLVVDNSTVQAQVLIEVRKIGGQTGVDVIRTILENATRPDGGNQFAALISLGMLIFSASNIFAQLQDTLNTIWGVRLRPESNIQGMVISRLLSFVLILGLCVLMMVLLLVDVTLALVQNFLSGRYLWLDQLQPFQTLGNLISFAVLTGIFAMLFKVMPDIRIAWRDVMVGSVVTALLMTLSRVLIGWYLSSSSLGTAYGAAGSTIVFLFWIYLMNQVFLFGAEFTEVYAREYGSPFQPRSYARWLPGREPPPEASDN